MMSILDMADETETVVNTSGSTLNPSAPSFVPRFSVPSQRGTQQRVADSQSWSTMSPFLPQPMSMGAAHYVGRSSPPNVGEVHGRGGYVHTPPRRVQDTAFGR